MNASKKRVVLSAGGTGGHVFPAHALAKELLSQGIEVILFTDGRGYQFRDPSVMTIKITACSIRGGLKQKLKAGISLIRGVSEAFFYLRRMKPQVVVGFGGYASFSTVVAALLLRIKTVVHQADAYLGRANRFLSPFVTGIATSFPHVQNIPSFCKKKVSFTGLPVRPEIQPSPYIIPEGKQPFYLLVTGGSQGARIFGELIPLAVSLLDPSLQKRLHITQQCREDSLQETTSLYAQTKAKVELSPFLDHMGEQYKKAHLVISRAGASSVVETALAGRPALFIPYPHAMDNHQFYNAEQAVQTGGAWIMIEKELTHHALANFLSDVIIFPWKLSAAAVNIQKIAVPDAAIKLAHFL